MAQFKSKNINALFVWFRLYVIKGYDGQWNIEHLKENLENAEKELRQLENKEVAHSASDNSAMVPCCEACGKEKVIKSYCTNDLCKDSIYYDARHQ